MAVRYTGNGIVRIGNAPIMPGDVVEDKPGIEAELLLRADFEAVQLDEEEDDGNDD